MIKRNNADSENIRVANKSIETQFNKGRVDQVIREFVLNYGGIASVANLSVGLPTVDLHELYLIMESLTKQGILDRISDKDIRFKRIRGDIYSTVYKLKS